MKENKTLIKVSNLKQYFPIKKKGMFVKANDGISLEIYEGETFGLVGESGCGKSTLGRVLLQLYHQTDGKTMYYGRALDDFAPSYVKETLENLDKLRKTALELAAKRDKIAEEYEKMGGDKALHDEDEKKDAKAGIYDKRNELEQIKKAANDAFLDIVEIIGGFYKLEDLKPVADQFLDIYHKSSQCHALENKMMDLSLELEDIKYKLEKQKEKGNDAIKLQSAFEAAENRVKEQQMLIDAKHQELLKAHAEVDKMRDKYKLDPEFQKYESYRDEGIDLARLKYSEMRLLRKDLQLIFQDPYSSLNPRMTVGQIIGEGLLAHKFFKNNDERMQEYIINVMEECGLQSYFFHRYPHQFSGGQRQRIGIARSLAVKPSFIVCDEAVSALDVSIQSQIINVLKDLKDKANLTYMFISHDLSVVKYISDRIGVMYLGNIVEMASTKDIFENHQHPYTEALISAIPTTDAGGRKREAVLLEGDIPSPINPPKGCKFHTRCLYATEICRHIVPKWEEIEPEHYLACHHPLGSRRS